jgi:hypothetical protein
MITHELIKYIKHRIRLHHKIYDLPVIAEYWEEIFAKSIEDIEGYTDWKADRSHSIGKDQICTVDGITFRVSNKSGKYNKERQTLKISGSRSGEYKTLQEKLKFFSDKQEDMYVCLATDEKRNPKKEYFLFSFSTDILNYSEANWEPKYSKSAVHTGWFCETDNYQASIQQSLSGQLWTKIYTAKANIFPEVICID